MGCGVSQFANFVMKLSTEQQQWVSEMGFEDLLLTKINNIDPTFGYWITSRFDPITLELKIRDNYYVKIDEEMVGCVLGIRSGDHLLVPNKSEKSVALETLRLYKQNTLYGPVAQHVVFEKVIGKQPEKEWFAKHFLLYVLGTILCPTQKCGWISPSHVYMLDKANNAAEYNWARYVLDWLVKYGKKFSTSREGYGGCTLLLLVSN